MIRLPFKDDRNMEKQCFFDNDEIINIILIFFQISLLKQSHVSIP